MPDNPRYVNLAEALEAVNALKPEITEAYLTTDRRSGYVVGQRHALDRAAEALCLLPASEWPIEPTGPDNSPIRPIDNWDEI